MKITSKQKNQNAFTRSFSKKKKKEEEAFMPRKFENALRSQI